MRNLMCGVVGVLSLLAVSAAKAEPINGQISFIGFDNYNTDTGQVNFVGTGGVGATYGSFANTAFAQSCFGCVSFGNFNYKNLAPVTFYSASLNGDTTSFKLNSIDSYVADNNFLSVKGSGEITLNKNTTLGSLLFTTQAGSTNMNVTFSATTVANSVPEPSSLLVLGVGLIGLLALRKQIAA